MQGRGWHSNVGQERRRGQTGKPKDKGRAAGGKTGGCGSGSLSRRPGAGSAAPPMFPHTMLHGNRNRAPHHRSMGESHLVHSVGVTLPAGLLSWCQGRLNAAPPKTDVVAGCPALTDLCTVHLGIMVLLLQVMPTENAPCIGLNLGWCTACINGPRVHVLRRSFSKSAFLLVVIITDRQCYVTMSLVPDILEGCALPRTFSTTL